MSPAASPAPPATGLLPFQVRDANKDRNVEDGFRHIRLEEKYVYSAAESAQWEPAVLMRQGSAFPAQNHGSSLLN